MVPATLTNLTFKASSPSGLLPGAVTYADKTATLSLDARTPVNTTITATITAAVTDVSGRALASDYVWTFTTGATTDTTAPTVSSTDPTNGATNVSSNKAIGVVFSEAMAVETLNAGTFKLVGPSGAVAGTVTALNNAAQFKPTTVLTSGAVYTATITSGVKDLSENSLAADKVWSFTAGVNTDTTAPRVVSTDPANQAIDVPTNKSVTVTFSEAMDADTLNASTFTLKRANGTVVPSVLTYANKVAVLNPTSSLPANSILTVTVSKGATDLAGNPLESAQVWSFTTAAVGDTIAPTVASTSPASNATNVFLNQSVSARFSEPMKVTTVNTATFTVAGVSGTVTYDTGSNIATFNPLSDLAPNTTYTAQIDTGAKDAAGNGLAVAKTWSFTTGIQRAQVGIDLGAAGNYAVLAGSTVTNSGPTILNGDLGVSPGSAVTGFPPGKVNGSVHAGDAVAAKAKADLLVGQLDAAGRLGGATLPGDLSGLTFTPGLYKNSSSVMLSAGNVTLDAQGDANAVFIFQMASTLTTSTGTQVILAGGAQAGNVYWSVGSSATLGVNSIFKGIVLAEVSITVNNGAVSDGTFLTKIGAVTLESNTITRSPRAHS